MSEFKMLINGELVAGVSVIDVLNPADETVVAACPVASETQLDDAVVAANTAFANWKNTSYEERASLIDRLCQVRRLLAVLQKFLAQG